jgi:hypothetical protein
MPWSPETAASSATGSHVGRIEVLSLAEAIGRLIGE